MAEISAYAAFLTLNTVEFEKGFDKASKAEQKALADMEKSARASMAQIRKEFGATGTAMERLSAKQAGVSIRGAGGGIGQSLGGIRTMSRSEATSALSADKAGFMESALKLGVAMKGLDVAFKVSNAVLMNYSGSTRNFGSLLNAFGKTIRNNADQLVAAIPIFGKALSDLIKTARGDDIKEATAANEKANAKGAAEMKRKRMGIVSGFGDQTNDLAREAQMSTMDEHQKKLAQIEFKRQDVISNAEKKLNESGGLKNADTIKAQEQLVAQANRTAVLEREAAVREHQKEIYEKAVADAKEADRKRKELEREAKERRRVLFGMAQENADLDTEIAVNGAKAKGQDLVAEAIKINRDIDKAQTAAREAGNMDAVGRLEELRGQRMAGLKSGPAGDFGSFAANTMSFEGSRMAGQNNKQSLESLSVSQLETLRNILGALKAKTPLAVE